MLKIGFIRDTLILDNLPKEVIPEVLSVSKILDKEYNLTNTLRKENLKSQLKTVSTQ